jgi:hypothetical protein
MQGAMHKLHSQDKPVVRKEPEKKAVEKKEPPRQEPEVKAPPAREAEKEKGFLKSLFGKK